MPRSKPPRRKKGSGAKAAPAPLDRTVLEALLGGMAEMDDPLNRAQELVYDAWDSVSANEQVRLAGEALIASPLCADAYAILAEHAEPGSESRLGLYRRALAAAEEALGPEPFAEDVGHFWGLLETRPYMRARFGLGQALWDRGDRDEAVGHWADLLRLNPDDNQGVRYVLMNAWLELGRHGDLEWLMEQYPDDGGIEFAYGCALLAFRQEADTEASRRQLSEAVARNPLVPDYLLGRRRLPKEAPPFFTLGGEDEAICYVMSGRAAWDQTEGALEWLTERSGARRQRSRRQP